eukprot:TRINITY_DN3561_c0_g2_i1.p1 TRINITY_DN3561_c0_g2~~TRINITY_DN3561_c0_g2_i1.p1  ORF type:complete len:988 (-),score=245.23 TRINITY_DN3561_c0_g2_i1:45-3008(-)
MNVLLTIESAKNLVSHKHSSRVDPYVRVSCNKYSKDTNWKCYSSDPVWDQSFELECCKHDKLLFEVFDFELTKKHSLLGSYEFNLQQIKGTEYRDTVDLLFKEKTLPEAIICGTLTFRISCSPVKPKLTIPIKVIETLPETTEINGKVVEIYDSVIVGAGFSGITAAKQLLDKGKTVKVFDMNSFYGGRTWTKKRELKINGKDITLDLNMGGEYFGKYFQVSVNRYEKDSPFNPKGSSGLKLGNLYSLALKHKVPFTDTARNTKSWIDKDGNFQTNGICSTFYGTDKVIPKDFIYRWAIPPEEWDSPVAGGLPYSGGNPEEDWPSGQSFAMAFIIILLEGISAIYGYYRNQPWLCPISKDYDNISVSDWFESKIWLQGGPAALTANMAASVYFSTSPDEISPQYFIWYSNLNGSLLAATNDFNLGPQQYFFNGGMQSIYDAEYGPYKQAVQLSTRVEKIEHKNGFHLVTTSDDETVAGRTVIISGSPHTVGNTIEFKPELADGRQIFNEQNMGRTLKCFLYYEQPWWRDIDITYYYNNSPAGKAGYCGYFAAVGPIPNGIYPDQTPVVNPAWVVWCMDNTVEPDPEVYTLMVFVIADGISDQPDIEDEQIMAKKIAQQISVQWSKEGQDGTFSPSLEAYNYIGFDMYTWKKSLECTIGGGPVSVMGPNASNAIGDAINNIQDLYPNRFFTGSEYAQDTCGYVDGAIDHGKFVGDAAIDYLDGNEVMIEPEKPIDITGDQNSLINELLFLIQRTENLDSEPLIVSIEGSEPGINPKFFLIVGEWLSSVLFINVKLFLSEAYNNDNVGELMLYCQNVYEQIVGPSIANFQSKILPEDDQKPLFKIESKRKTESFTFNMQYNGSTVLVYLHQPTDWSTPLKDAYVILTYNQHAFKQTIGQTPEDGRFILLGGNKHTTQGEFVFGINDFVIELYDGDLLLGVYYSPKSKEISGWERDEHGAMFVHRDIDFYDDNGNAVESLLMEVVTNVFS